MRLSCVARQKTAKLNYNICEQQIDNEMTVTKWIQEAYILMGLLRSQTLTNCMHSFVCDCVRSLRALEKLKRSYVYRRKLV